MSYNSPASTTYDDAMPTFDDVTGTFGDDDVFLSQVDDERLKAAVKMAEMTGEVTPLIKQEIRYLIQARRLSEGKSEELADDTGTSSSNELSCEDYCRRDKRKLQNRMAAQKYRQKKKDEKDILTLQILMLEIENSDLQQNVSRLKGELWALKEFVATHWHVFPTPHNTHHTTHTAPQVTHESTDATSQATHSFTTHAPLYQTFTPLPTLHSLPILTQL